MMPMGRGWPEFFMVTRVPRKRMVRRNEPSRRCRMMFALVVVGALTFIFFSKLSFFVCEEEWRLLSVRDFP